MPRVCEPLLLPGSVERNEPLPQAGVRRLGQDGRVGGALVNKEERGSGRWEGSVGEGTEERRHMLS